MLPPSSRQTSKKLLFVTLSALALAWPNELAIVAFIEYASLANETGKVTVILFLDWYPHCFLTFTGRNKIHSWCCAGIPWETACRKRTYNRVVLPAIRTVILADNCKASIKGNREANCFRAAARARLIRSPLLSSTNCYIFPSRIGCCFAVGCIYNKHSPNWCITITGLIAGTRNTKNIFKWHREIYSMWFRD